jgi:hypothetical protein
VHSPHGIDDLASGGVVEKPTWPSSRHAERCGRWLELRRGVADSDEPVAHGDDDRFEL